MTTMTSCAAAGLRFFVIATRFVSHRWQFVQSTTIYQPESGQHSCGPIIMSNRKRDSRPSSGRKGVAGKRPKGPPAGRPAFLSDGEKGTRLQKFLANAGVDSRRNCEELIRTGRVTIDGKVVKNPAVSVMAESQDVRLDGERLQLPRFRYYLLNKPKGVVCTNRDPAGRPRAVDLVPNLDQKLFTVGRLDENTQGLLLITNDGALAEHLAHPRYEVIRRYRAQVAGIPEPATLTELRNGMYFSDGFFRFQTIRLAKRKGRSAILELELREGKNREIRRLLARAGHKVMHLERVAFGPLRIGRLEAGKCRELGSQELSELYAYIQKVPDVRNAPEKRPPRKRVATKRSRPAAKDEKRSVAGGSRRGGARHGKPASTTTRKRAPGGRGAQQRIARKK